MIGVAVVTEPLAYELPRPFADEVVTFADPQDCVDICDELLEPPATG